MKRVKDFVTYVSSGLTKAGSYSYLAELRSEELYKDALSKIFESSTIKPKEINIFKMRSGWKGKPGTLEELKEELGVSEGYISKIESELWGKIRSYPRIKNFDRYVKEKIWKDISCGKYGIEVKFFCDWLRGGIEALKLEIDQYQLEQKSTDILNKSIEELELSTRAYNCLKNCGLETIREVTEKTERGLLSRRNFGTKSLEELKETLAKFGLGLKE